jgi:hypothetical protein
MDLGKALIELSLLDFSFGGRNSHLSVRYQFAPGSTTVQDLLDYVLNVLALYLRKDEIRTKDYSVNIAVFDKEWKKWYSVGVNQPTESTEYKVTMIIQ